MPPTTDNEELADGGESAKATEEDAVGRKPRILGLNPGAFQPAPNFDDPMPDEFWLGES